MHAVILAAGEGSRMGSHTDNVPKAFLEIDGRTLYDYQRDVLDDHVDAVTVVVGYCYENVVDEVDLRRTLVVESWDEYENAESLNRALQTVDDDVLVLNGDVVVTDQATARLVRTFERSTVENVVGYIPGFQHDHTAIRLDEDETVVDYGEIAGHRHAGIGVLGRDHLPAARRHLRSHRKEWYPTVYPELPTRGVPVPADEHIEINRPEDMRAAREQLPLS